MTEISKTIHSNDVSLPQQIYYADWVREAEKIGAAQLGISLYELMEKAGSAVFELCRTKFPQSKHWLILCGNGNNGGDAFVVARLAIIGGIKVTIVTVSGNSSLPKEASQAKSLLNIFNVNQLSIEEPWPDDIDLLVDGLLGIGLEVAPRQPYLDLIRKVNAHCIPVVAIDIPSGLLADKGSIPEIAIKATYTLTFVVLKPGLLTGQARDYVGQLHYNDLGMQPWLLQQSAQLSRYDEQNLAQWFKPRRRCAHKGDYGRLLIIGGDVGFGGAIRMAGEAALRSGAGLVRVITHEHHVNAVLGVCPELMVASPDFIEINEWIDWADVLVIGPGLGQREWGKNLFDQLKNSNKPMLMDADALNLLAQEPKKLNKCILTPHPGEAAKLLGCRVNEIESDRLLSARRLAKKYNSIVVLKGAGTIVADQHQSAIIDVGNPGMATGGMGDVLSGIIGGLLAQKESLFLAACIGCTVHGAAADSIARIQGERGLLASDVIKMIVDKINPK